MVAAGFAASRQLWLLLLIAVAVAVVLHPLPLHWASSASLCIRSSSDWRVCHSASEADDEAENTVARGNGDQQRTTVRWQRSKHTDPMSRAGRAAR